MVAALARQFHRIGHLWRPLHSNASPGVDVHCLRGCHRSAQVSHVEDSVGVCEGLEGIAHG
jgi:hypothetical protein